MMRSKITDANMAYTIFVRSNFKAAIFTEAQMHHCAFTKADLSFSNLDDVILRKVRLNLHTRNRQKEDLIELLADIRNMDEDPDVFVGLVKSRAEALWKTHMPRSSNHDT